MEYISREAAIAKSFHYLLPNGEESPPVVFTRAIKSIPAADVREVRHGKWINQRADSEMCSACGVRFYISALFAVGGNDEPNYCPNCGALMDKDGDA